MVDCVINITLAPPPTINKSFSSINIHLDLAATPTSARERGRVCDYAEREREVEIAQTIHSGNKLILNAQEFEDVNLLEARISRTFHPGRDPSPELICMQHDCIIDKLQAANPIY